MGLHQNIHFDSLMCYNTLSEAVLNLYQILSKEIQNSIWALLLFIMDRQTTFFQC